MIERVDRWDAHRARCDRRTKLRDATAPPDQPRRPSVPASGKEPQRVYRRQAMMVGQSYDFVAMNGGECVRKDKQTAIRFTCQRIEDIIDVGRRIYVRWDRLHAQKGGRFRDRPLIADPARMVWILQDRDARHGKERSP